MIAVGVTGYPVTHSRSPVIFGHWFERYAIDARYALIEVKPEEAEGFFAALPQEWSGVNVTVPHKATAARHVVTEGAGARLGVVNTLWRDGDVVRGTSSDGPGFVASLDASAPSWRDNDGPCVILGAGGAAVAIADALVGEQRMVVIANRTPARAQEAAERTGATAHSLDGLGAVLPSAALLVNATSLGMTGGPALSFDLSLLPATAVVSDIVYNPLQTPLLAAARARGLATVDGLGMLLHQATLGFEKWFGLRPVVDDGLHAKVVATL